MSTQSTRTQRTRSGIGSARRWIAMGRRDFRFTHGLQHLVLRCNMPWGGPWQTRDGRRCGCSEHPMWVLGVPHVGARSTPCEYSFRGGGPRQARTGEIFQNETIFHAEGTKGSVLFFNG